MLPEEAMEAGAVAEEGVGLADEAEQPVGEAQTEAEVAADGSLARKIGHERVTAGGALNSARGTADSCGDGHFWTPRGVRNSDAYSEALSWKRRKREGRSDSPVKVATRVRRCRVGSWLPWRKFGVKGGSVNHSGRRAHSW